MWVIRLEVFLIFLCSQRSFRLRRDMMYKEKIDVITSDSSSSLSWVYSMCQTNHKSFIPYTLLPNDGGKMLLISLLLSRILRVLYLPSSSFVIRILNCPCIEISSLIYKYIYVYNLCRWIRNVGEGEVGEILRVLIHCHFLRRKLPFNLSPC